MLWSVQRSMMCCLSVMFCVLCKVLLLSILCSVIQSVIISANCSCTLF